MIFISHSSKDHDAAVALHAQLLGRDYDPAQIFLDSDVDSGIAAGEPWQQVLYERLKACRALIVLCTQNWLDSKWCFAELIYAKASGKEIFPVILEPCDFRGVLDEHQAVLVHRDGDAAYERLWRALDTRHLGPRDDFGWPPKDSDPCPFPGLLSFDERYAGVYFGREPETRAVLEELRKMRANGEPRLLMITGGSGSGKSSLLKAGVLPQLTHKSSGTEWLVLPVLRYGQAPSPQHTVFDQLAMNVAGANWKSLRDSVSAKAFVDAVRDLAVARGSPEATVLLPIDQFEELLAPGADAAAFLAILHEVFGCANGRLLAIGTLRSDHLDVYERHPHALTAPYFQPWRLGPFPRERVRDVIVKPAARAGVEVTPELLARLERDTPTSESLPLLAFTLEKLYRRYAADRKLELQEYEDLGGMEGAIQKSADAIALAPDVVDAVRLTFVKHLASVNDKDEVVRVTARWAEVPEPAKPVLEKFVDERLLVKNDESLEVAHEALFRAWPALREWLRDAADILRWRRDVQRDRAADPKWSGLRPAQLAVARPWLRHRRSELADEEVQWIQRSIRRERMQRVGFAAAAAIVVAVAIYAWIQKRAADRESQSSLGKYLASQSMEVANAQARHSDLSLLLAIEAYRRDPSGIAASRLRSAMAGTPVPIARLKHGGPLLGVAFSPDSRWLATVEDKQIRVWDFERQQLVASMRGKDLRGISWRRDGAQLTVQTSPDGILVWDWRTNRPPVTSVAVDFDFASVQAHAGISSGQHIAFAVQEDERTTFVHVVDAATRRPVARPFVMPDGEYVSTLAFRPDGQALAIASYQGWTRIWDWRSEEVLVAHRGDRKPLKIVFSPDGALVAELASIEWSPAIRLWRTSTGEDLYRFQSEERLPPTPIWAAFTGDGRHLVASLGDHALRAFSVSPAGQILQFSSGSLIYAADADRTGTFAAAGTDDGWVTVWRLEPGHAVRQFANIYEVMAAPRGDVLALLGRNSELFDVASRTAIMPLGHVTAGRAVFSKDGQRFAHATGDEIVLTDLRSKRTRVLWRGVMSSALQFSPDGKRLLVAGVDGAMAAIDLSSGARTQLRATRPHGYGAFSPDGRFFVEKKGPIHLYDVTARKKIGEIHSNAFENRVRFNAQGTLFFAYLDEFTVGVWSTEPDQVLWIRVDRTRPPVVFDPSGRFLAVGNEAAIQIFDAIEERQVRTLSQLGGSIHSLAYTPDGGHLAAFSADGSIRVWRVEDSELVMVIPQGQSFEPGMPPILFTPDGRYLVVPQQGGARLVIWRPDDVLREACRRSFRKKLDPPEWKTFLPGQPFRSTCDGY